MRQIVVGGLIVFALLLAVSQLGMGTGQTRRALAQDATPVATVIAQPVATVAQPAQTTDNENEFPWGLLGLLGLAGLAGLRRPEEPVRRETGQVKPTVGAYDNPKR